MGDWVLTLPLLDAVKAARPDVRLTVMAAETVAPLLRRQAAVDDVIPRPGGGARGFWRGVGRVRAGGFDAAVVVHPDLRDTLMVWGAGVPVRVGNGYRGYSFLYNRRVYFHRSPSEHHEVEYNLRYLEGLGLRPPAKAPAPRVAVTDEDRARARDVLKRHGVDRDGYAVIHPGSSGSALNWSPARYRTLALELGKALGVSIVVTGSAVEADLAAAVAGEGGARVSIAGETDLAALLGVLAGAGLFISSSTGPMHLAAAVGTPTVALFPPFRAGGATRWGPYGDAVTTITPAGLFCETCSRERCEHYNCMEAITLEEVLAAARRVARPLRDI